MLDAGFCFGVGREHALNVALLGTALVLKLKELLERHCHAVGVAAMLHEEIVSALVGLILLLLGVF